MGKVCFYVLGFPPEFSGATLQMLYLAEYLKKKRVDSFFLAYTYNRAILTSQNHQDFKVIRFLRPEGPKLLQYHLLLFYHLFKQRKHYSVLYVGDSLGQFWTIMWSAMFSTLFSKKFFVELNMHVEGHDPISILDTRFEKMKKWWAKRVDCFISNSMAITRSFKSHHPDLDNIATVFYGIDTERFKKAATPGLKADLRRGLGIPVKAKVAMACGIISKRKGIDFLLDCWEQISLAHKEPCYLVIVGPYENVRPEEFDTGFIEQMIHRINTTHLAQTVILTGQVDNVDHYMQAADLFLFTSRQEGSPSVIREAMATSLPVVSLNLPNITEEMIDHGQSGFIVPLKDYQNFSNFTTEPINDETAKATFVRTALRLMQDTLLAETVGQTARQKIEDEFSFEAKVDRYLTLFGIAG